MGLKIFGVYMETPAVEPTGEAKQRENQKHSFLMWETLFEVDTKYIPIKTVGQGTYGVVCSARNTETNENVAIKKINDVLSDDKALSTLRELKILKQIQHENVVVLKDVMIPSHRRTFNDVYLVYELMDSDLDHIIKYSQLSNDHCKFLMFQLLQGLNCLHSLNILHRDLKPGNLLVNANWHLKICDFGLARTCGGSELTNYVVTRWYRAPELLCGCFNYGTAVDVWSVGCIFAEILGGEPLFPGANCLEQLKLISNVIGNQISSNLDFIRNPRVRRYIESLPYFGETDFARLYPQVDPLAIDLLRKMLMFDPSNRITVKEALLHPYLSDLYDPSNRPPAQVPIDLDIEDDEETDIIREMMWDEMLHYHPELASSNS